MFAKIVGAALVIATVGAPGVYAQQFDPRISDLVQAGRVRVALGLGSPVLALKDASSGEVRGPALDLAKALAEKIGVKLEVVEYPRPGAILGGLKNSEWDVTFLVADPTRSSEVESSPPYLQSDFTYLVPAGSPKRSVADMDQAGVRIAVPRGDASDLRLTQLLKRAELVRIDTIAAAIDMVRAGTVDAYAAPRVVLLALSKGAPGSRVLDDGFASIAWVAMVPKDKTARMAYVSEFLEEAKMSGLVKRIIDGANLRGLEVVAPFGKTN